jgi:hypothetical protein
MIRRFVRGNPDIAALLALAVLLIPAARLPERIQQRVNSRIHLLTAPVEQRFEQRAAERLERLHETLVRCPVEAR